MVKQRENGNKSTTNNIDNPYKTMAHPPIPLSPSVIKVQFYNISTYITTPRFSMCSIIYNSRGTVAYNKSSSIKGSFIFSI